MPPRPIHRPARMVLRLVLPLALAAHAALGAGPSGDGGAQVAAQPPPDAEIARLRASVPPPRPADVASIEAIVAAVYASIDGPAGKRDWNRFRSLFLPEARLTYSSVDPQGHAILNRLSVGDFIAGTDEAFTKEAFYEKPIVNRIDRFGNVAQVFTSYASRRSPTGAPFQRGINSMQFVFDGKRWWTLSILWDIERPGNPLPAAMLSPAHR